MEEIKKEIQEHKIFERWEYLEKHWNEHLTEIDALLIKYGNDDDQVIKIKTLAVQSWFYKFQFVDSISIITKNALIFFSSKDKINFLSFLDQKSKVHNKRVIFVEKANPVTQDDVQNLIKICKSEGLKSFGIFEKEIQKGPMIELFDDAFEKEGFQTVPITNNIQQILAVKDQESFELLKKTAEITTNFFQDFVNEVEIYLDEGTRIKHSDISRKMEDKLDKSKIGLKKKFEILSQFYDFSYTPVIQSGGEYDLRPNVESNDKLLKDDVILMSMAGKYFEMNCHLSRTLLINPTTDDQKSYQALHFLHKEIINNLKIGQKLSTVYNKVKDTFVGKFPNYEESLPNNFGFGMGYEFRERLLVISPKNSSYQIKEGNVFCVITTLKDIKGKNGTYCLQLADTIFVKREKIVNLTKHISAEYGDIGYDMSDEQQPKNKYEKPVMPVPDINAPRVSRAQKRREQNIKEQERLKRLKENQARLLEEKNSDLQERVNNGTLKKSSGKSEKIDLVGINAYPRKNVPQFDNQKIHIDEENNTVLIPINGRLVPIHIACIKNVTRHADKTFSALRINLQTPSISTGNVDFPLAQQINGNPIYIKELTFKSTDQESLQNITKQIKEMQKQYKVNLSINEKFMKKLEQETLRDKLKTLQNVKIRPTLQGRKSEGSLTAYKNGFKFISKNHKTFDLMLSNIRQAIYQPCDENMIVIIHFLLKNPMNIKGKLTEHIQFYTDVGYGIEDLHDPKNRRRGYDEEDEEMLEEEARRYHNNLYFQFVKFVEQNWDCNLKFDSPYPELGFFGSPSSNNVFIMPTTYSLISIIEKPFFVVILDDIELVSIERIDNKIKNFDMIIIFKDYTRPVKTIDNIPKENLEAIKEWLNSQDLLFIEGGTINIKWDKYLKSVLSDPQKFLNEGGWAGFQDDSESEEEQEEEDSEFDDDEVDEEEDEEDDFDFEEEFEEEGESEVEEEEYDEYSDEDQ